MIDLQASSVGQPHTHDHIKMDQNIMKTIQPQQLNQGGTQWGWHSIV
jgi:hypothetical protein